MSSKTTPTENEYFSQEQIADKLIEYTFNPIAFIVECVKILDAVKGEWIPFEIWKDQKRVIRSLRKHRLHVILKARQIGLTWLALSYALWLMIFRPVAEVLIFSRRDTEAVYLVHDRLRGMYMRLPAWIRNDIYIVEDSAHELGLSNGSIARAFPTSAGDSYTAKLAIVDEADLVPDLERLMKAVKPTIDGGGEMILLSRVDKKRPNSMFKQIYKEAKAGITNWKDIFLPWFARPDRTAQWYEDIKTEIFSRTGSLDELKEQYPATDQEALSPRSMDKRIPAQWIENCYDEREPIPLENIPNAPSIPGLVIYKPPELGKMYVIGADPAEGNPNSDESAVCVMDEDGEEVACLAGLHHPTPLSNYIHLIAEWYSVPGQDGENQNEVYYNIERNNHGHAVIQWLKEHSYFKILKGHDDKEGYMSSTKGKSLLYNAVSDSLRDGDLILHSWDTYLQLSSIDGNSLSAPEGERDDRADAYALAADGVNKISNRWLLG